MQFSKFSLASVVTLSLLATAGTSQIQVFGGPDADRKCSTVVMFGDNVMAGVSISYSAPEWKASYDKPGAMDQFKGKNMRLGKNWWTTLDTNVALDIAGTKIEPGAYFLGMHLTMDGGFQLLALRSNKAMKQSMMPFNPNSWKGGKAINMKLSKDSLDKSHERMVITISAVEDNPSKGKLSIKWGKHQLSAKVKFNIDGAAEASARKKDKKN